MSAIETITKAAHLIDMNDIIREGHPTLRAIAEEVTFPLSDQDIILGEKMMQFLHHSQDPVMAEKLGLRGGVGLAAPQLDISCRSRPKSRGRRRKSSKRSLLHPRSHVQS